MGNRLKERLKKSRFSIVDKITEIIRGKVTLDEELFEEIEDILISADIGYEIVDAIIDETRKELFKQKAKSEKSIIEVIHKKNCCH